MPKPQVRITLYLMDWDRIAAAVTVGLVLAVCAYFAF